MNDFEIIAFNGITGDCLTTADEATQDDWCQRLKENASEPELPPEEIEAIRQQHEAFLTKLEALAVQAIASGFWDEVYDHINCNAPEGNE
jgi:L-fucose isomerase-like protein